MENFKETVQYMLRHPGGWHDWLPVARADKIRAWGIAYEEFCVLRTPVKDVAFINPQARHGGPGSVKAHHEILDIFDRSSDFSTYKKALRAWADKRLQGGAKALPPGLQD